MSAFGKPLRLRVFRLYADLPWRLDTFSDPAPTRSADRVSPALEVVEVMPVSEHQELQGQHTQLQRLTREVFARMDALALRNIAQLPDPDYQAEVVAALNALREAVPGA